MIYYLIIALQGYCIYHLYTHRNAYYWWFLIICLPPIGCIIYLITQVYNKRDAEKVTNEITHIINPGKKIRDLEKQLQFAETYQNQLNLADAYLEIGDYNNAISQYLEVLKDDSQNNFYAITQLIEAYYNIKDFDHVIMYAEKVKTQSEFNKSRTQFLYGLALEHVGQIDEAEVNLRQIDIRYSFYKERLMLARFLLKIGKEEEAIEILNDIYTESSHMTKTNKRIYRSTILEVEKLLKELN
ncbi:tetratricopeptide repeat protein [Tamlana sp. 2201CG12-4]|uniref:tetratricopeptide repeat protein n=1 Tax=Tamlana sp. 2201CG12-4 TaxID=3112582 RepID=UPI002DBF019D|nr:tetratricopeptide repeat protein [Tamlana sp. 2201CG12-4]MEC3907144.1 tetratricopeptide repeat protein [Tamlana sp. 2201CG12-4]